MRKPTVASGLPWQRCRVPASAAGLSLAGLGVAALLGSTVLAMLKGAVVLLALSLAGLGVAALLGSAVLVMLKGAVVLAFFVWVAAVASRRYGHGSWPRSDGGGIGYTVAVEVVRKPLLTLLVVLGLGLGVTGTVSSIFLILSILACMGVCIALRRLVEGVRDTVRQWRHAPRKSRAARASGALATRLPRSKRAIGGSRPIKPSTCSKPTGQSKNCAFCQAVASDRPGHRRGRSRRANRRAAPFCQAVALGPTRTPPRGLRFRRWQRRGKRWAHRPPSVCRAPPPTAALYLNCISTSATCDEAGEHVLDEARSNIWDALNDHRIAFTFPAYDRDGPTLPWREVTAVGQ